MPYFVFVLNDGYIDRQDELPMLPATRPDGDWYEVGGILTLPRTNTSQRWQWNSGSPVLVDPRPISSLKEVKKSEINSSRLSANRGFFMFQGKQVACDELSRSDIDAVNGVVSLIGSVPINQWKAVDNSYIAIPDKATWIQFYLAMVQTGQANFNHSQSLKARLEEALTIQEIAAIKWS